MTKEQSNALFAKGILQICQELHMRHTGTGPDMSDQDVQLSLKYLHERLRNWSQPTSSYDARVGWLIHATIAEWE